MCCIYASIKKSNKFNVFSLIIYLKKAPNDLNIMKFMKSKINQTVPITILFFLLMILNSCKSLPGSDAREVSPDPKDRVAKNIEEGRGFRLSNTMFGNSANPGNFEFASSNELWRASLDTLDFMPLALANYSGGLIVTDWYNDGSSQKESVKISVRFLSNEVRSDALSIKVFFKNCGITENCKITDRSKDLSSELTKKILTQAAIYEKQNKGKNKKPYVRSDINK